MKRILIGLIVAAVLAAGGWFGFNLYVQHRATSEVEAAFEQMRQQGGKASHGKIDVRAARRRTLTIEDIAVDPGSQPQAQVKIAGVKATGVRQLDESTVLGRQPSTSRALRSQSTARSAHRSSKAVYKIPQTDDARLRRSRSTPQVCAGIQLHHRPVPVCVSAQFSERHGVLDRGADHCRDFDRRQARRGQAGRRRFCLFRPGDAESQARQDRGDEGGPRRHLHVRRSSSRQAGQADGRAVEPPSSTISMSAAMLAALDPQTSERRQLPPGLPADLGGALHARRRHGRCASRSTASPSRISPCSRRNSGWPTCLPRCRRISRHRRRRRKRASMLEKLAGVYEGLRIGKIEIGKTSIGTPQGNGQRSMLVRYRRGRVRSRRRRYAVAARAVQDGALRARNPSA